MNSDISAHRRSRAVAALVPLFVVSGATSLVYEILWERQLHLIVGTSQIAVVIVLAAFMSGLAAGGFLSGRRADRVARPLVAYAILEGLIGLYALVFPHLLSAVAPAYGALHQALQPSPLAFAALQFVLLGVFLLPPTVCMGATLPLLARFATVHSIDAGRQVGRLYGANTIGAVVGVGLAGFVLLPTLGLEATTFATAAGNLLLCLAAARLGMSVAPLEPAPPEPRAAAATAIPWLTTTCALALVAGLGSLMCEVAWFRLMVLTLGGSAYAFSIMLLAFLIGIGSGGWIGGRIADRAFKKGGAARVLAVLSGAQLMVAALVYGAMYLYGNLPVVFVHLYDAVAAAPALIWPAKLLIALGLMVPPALLMGASFPLLVRAVAREDRLGGAVGRLYGWNTVGAILGAVLGGLVLLPTIEVRGTLLIAISLNLLAALAARDASARAAGTPAPLPRRLGGLALLAGVVALVHIKPPPWDPLLMTAGMYKYVSDLEPEDRNRAGVVALAIDPYDLLFYKEGLSSVVTVAQGKESGNIWLANNGKVDASTNIDMPTQVLCAHLPFLFAPHAETVAVIGLASGITAGAVTLHERPKIIDIIELEPAIVEASHFFDAYNHRPLEDSRVTLFAEDGRNFMTLQPEGRYDLVVSEPSNPWLSGVSNLFTAEFFELGKARLAPGGVWSQWVQMYGMDEADLRSLLRTFSSTYDHVLLFSTIDDADLVLVGSDSPLKLDAENIAAVLADRSAVRRELAEVSCRTPQDIIARFIADREDILTFAGDAELNTDDNMRIEYSAPLNLHRQTAEANFLELISSGDVRESVPMSSVSGLEGQIGLARAYGRRGDWVRALLVLKATESINPGDKSVEWLFENYQDKLELELDGEAVDTGVPPMPMTPDLDEAAPVEADPVEMGQDEGIQDR